MSKNKIYSHAVFLSFFMLFVLSSIILLTGCARTQYVCYDGTVQKTEAKCPIVQIPTLTSQNAEQIADNYGRAVANAKRDSYTRVNVYSKNSTWYANMLFTNSGSGNIANVLLQIDGKTGDVTCMTGCEYIGGSGAVVDNSVAG